MRLMRSLYAMMRLNSVSTIAGLLFICAGVVSYATEPPTSAETSLPPVTFERDVMSVLSKSGCNAGTCHGNLNGKGGFFLSLRGQDPEFDYEQLVFAAAGRRINPLAPEESFAIAKATARVAHEGGKRLREGTPEYDLLVGWVKAGMPAPNAAAPKVSELRVTPPRSVLFQPQSEVQLSVQVTFSDGSTRDVTRLAVYEPSDPTVQVTVDGLVTFAQPGLVTVLVRYLNAQHPVELACRINPPDFQWSAPQANNWIDPYIFDRLRELKINPAPLAGDSTFLRRVSLDLRGILPTAEESRAFVEDASPDKRAPIVDRYLASPEFASLWAQRWSDLIRNEEKTLDAVGVEKLHGWLVGQFANDVPMDEMVRRLITARGRTYDNPPANYWRAHREPFVRSETTAQVFLGVRLQCAKCHNHPFDRWSQDEYYQWSSLFDGIDYEVIANERKDKLDSHEFVGDQIVLVKATNGVKNARTGQLAPPKFLGSEASIEEDRLESLAAWMTSPDNSMFAQTQVNRIWYQLMGVGLVEPIDDLRATNPASHPELFKRLSEEFVQSGFSLKQMVRTIVLSKTYQLDSKPDRGQLGPTEQLDPRLLASAVVRRLTAEQIMDAQSQILGVPANFEGYPAGTRAVDIAGVERVRRKTSGDDQFLRQFGKPARLLACECERSNEATLGQALSLVGGSSLNERLRQSDNRLGQLLSQSGDPSAIVESLYWTALSRAPTAQEIGELLNAMEQSGKPQRENLEDFLWALLNSKELLFRN